MKNVRVDENFLGLLKSESVLESFLSENMLIVERLGIHDDIAEEDISRHGEE